MNSKHFLKNLYKQQHLKIFSKLLQHHFLFQILIYQVVNLIILRLQCYTKLFHIDIILEQNKIVEQIENAFTIP